MYISWLLLNIFQLYSVVDSLHDFINFVDESF